MPLLQRPTHPASRASGHVTGHGPVRWTRRLLRVLGRLSLARQLVLLAVLPATVTTLATVAVLTHQHLANVTELMGANARTVALQLATLAEAPLARMDRRALQHSAQSGTYQPHVQQVQIWSADGEIVADAQTVDRHRGKGLQVTAPVMGETGRELGKVMVEIDLDTVERARGVVWLNVLAVLAASAVGVGLAGWWAARRISAPIRTLGDALDRLRAGEEAHVTVEGTAEVRRLQRGFNLAAGGLAESRRLLESRIADATAELARKNRQLEVASRAKTRLLAAASHDLRQPLHALTLFSDGLSNGETDPVRLQRIGHVRECVDALDRLFTELLDLSQLDAGVLRPQWDAVPLDRVFDTVSRNFRAMAESQNLRLVVRKTDAWVHGDEQMLARILNNLVSNALRHTPAGGVLVAARSRGAQLSIEVWDTGIGIAPQHQARVFEEFFQIDAPARPGTAAPSAVGREPRGMGLGLATVERLAHLLDTQVELRSRRERGTVVRLRLRETQPLARQPASAAIPAPATADLRLDGLRLLVIDDERPILDGLQAVLSDRGAQVMAAQTRAEALALADVWEAPPDAVVSDLLLRDGDDGLDLMAVLARHPRGIGPRTARLIVTGEMQPERLRAVARAGIEVLAKPVTPRVLQHAIRAQLNALRATAP